MTDTAAGEPYRAGSALRQIEHTTLDERAAVIYGDDDAAAAMGDLEPGTERQGPVCGSHSFLIEALARGGLAARLVAVELGLARKAAAGADRGIGVAPGFALAGFSRSSAKRQNSDCNQRDRGIPIRNGSPRHALDSGDHIVVL